ncbi:RNA-binding motif%2C single-stranded-interacting protein 3 isoform X1 [Xyrichtys novacula]|uniref:RNA-binding motif, single-stranded-interacting protein 3 isoform X1 n=1 Tax=Xyrichtys novacula TaxID=13765 RepID=A0AAV1HCS4_XYRNO|nr:RNA-binding motif%2C single-stranded-interacting protein 3 isoform X1 [Xyrichtys novacula]
MEVQSGLQQPEPRPLGSPRLGTNQQSELEDRQADTCIRPSADNHSRDGQTASHRDDKKPTSAVRGYHSSKSASMNPSVGSSWTSGGSGGQGTRSSSSYTRASLQHYLSHHQQHPHHHPQSAHTGYTYCPAHTAEFILAESNFFPAFAAPSWAVRSQQFGLIEDLQCLEMANPDTNCKQRHGSRV